MLAKRVDLKAEVIKPHVPGLNCRHHTVRTNGKANNGGADPLGHRPKIELERARPGTCDDARRIHCKQAFLSRLSFALAFELSDANSLDQARGLNLTETQGDTLMIAD